MAFASESTHFYGRDGSSQWEVMAKNGKMRPSTLADARKNLWVPSVTEILKVAAKPGLERWKIQQTLEAALTLPRIEGEATDTFAKRVMEDSQAQASKARDLGSAIHGAIEKHLNGERYPQEYQPHVETAIASMEPYKGTGWRSEKSFASKLGYGGKVDLHSNICVADFKCKAFDIEDVKKAKLAWPEHLMQLAAYRHGLVPQGVSPDCDLVNVFVSTSIPGLVYVHRWAEGDEVAFQKFSSLLRYWQLDRGYDSSFF
jgi:hypothetical protein